MCRKKGFGYSSVLLVVSAAEKQLDILIKPPSNNFRRC